MLHKKIPNFRKLNGIELRKNIISDMAKKANEITNESKIIIKNISYQLDDVIITFIDFEINGKQQKKVYKLSTIDFNIIY